MLYIRLKKNKPYSYRYCEERSNLQIKHYSEIASFHTMTFISTASKLAFNAFLKINKYSTYFIEKFIFLLFFLTHSTSLRAGFKVTKKSRTNANFIFLSHKNCHATPPKKMQFAPFVHSHRTNTNVNTMRHSCFYLLAQMIVTSNDCNVKYFST